MDEIKWCDELHQMDKSCSPEEIKGETMYTLYQKDFLQMPEVKFEDLVAIDPHLRSLLN